MEKFPDIKVDQFWKSSCGNVWQVTAIENPDRSCIPCVWAWVRRVEPKVDTQQYYWHWLAFQGMTLLFQKD